MAEEQKTIDYEVTAEQRKFLQPQEISGFIKAFNNYDLNKDGTMDQKEFKNIMIDLGHRKTDDAAAQAMLDENDSNQDGVIEWAEFVGMMVKQKSNNPDAFGKISTNAAGTAVASIQNEHGGKHDYSPAQVATFSKLINVILKGDEDLGDYLPIVCDGDSLFHAFDNGVLLCKIVHVIDPDAIDLRVIKNTKNMSVFEINNNLKLGLAASKSLGVKLIGVAPADFVKKVPHLMLTAIWQLLRKAIATKISLGDCPELYRLLQEGEELGVFSKMKTEDILIRWVNYHLMKNGQSRQVKNLGKDLADSFALTHVLNRLDKGACSLDAIGGDDYDKNGAATAVIANSLTIGVPDLISPEDITSGEEKVLTLFVAYMFNTKHGLEELTADEYAKCAMIDDDIEGSREERAFRLWVNSLGIEGVYIDDLYDGISDGWTLCSVVDKVDPTVITWKNVAKTPKNYQFGNPVNLKEAITGCKGMGLKMIGIGANELNKKDKKEILATAWSICKTHYLKLIGGKTEKDLVAWANERVGSAAAPINSLSDKTNLSSGVFWIKLIATIESRGVDDELVTAGDNDEDKKMNAKYAISLARSIGAVVFMVWEDMVAANAKQNLILTATLFELSQTYGKEVAE